MIKRFIAPALVAGFFMATPVHAKTAVLVNGLGIYTKPGMMAQIGKELTQRGYKVIYLNHIEAAYLTEMPDVLIGHSMGANAVLKASQRFKTYPAKLIVSIDAGRAPLWWKAPRTKARTIDISCPLHLIGGQEIEGAAEKYEVCHGVSHLYLPHDPRVIEIIVKEVEKLK